MLLNPSEFQISLVKVSLSTSAVVVLGSSSKAYSGCRLMRLSSKIVHMQNELCFI